MSKKSSFPLALAAALFLSAVTGELLCYADLTEKQQEWHGTVSVTEQEARDLAGTYLSIDPYSKEGLEKELIRREMMPEAVAEKAAASADEDWQENAEEEAEKLEKMGTYTIQDIRKILRADGYTEEEIRKATEE